MQNAKNFWNKTALKYAKSPISDIKSYEYTLGRTKSYLGKSDKVLEIGCGTGSTALLLASNVQQITGSDLSDGMIAIAEKNAREQKVSNAEFTTAGVNALPFKNGAYDAVMAFNLIHLLEDTSAIMKRCHELVKPGGYFISKTVCKPGKGTPLKFKLLFMVLPVMQFLNMAPFVKFMEIPELEHHVTEAGFKIIETGNHPKAPPSRYIVAQKPK